MCIPGEDLIPEEFKRGVAKLIEKVDDDSVHPLEFVDEVDDFFRQLCAENGIDYEDTFGGFAIELKRKIEEKGQNGG